MIGCLRKFLMINAETDIYIFFVLFSADKKEKISAALSRYDKNKKSF